MQAVVLIKMCLNETNRSVQIQKQLPQFLNFALECAITKDKQNKDRDEMNGKHQFLVYVDLHIRYGFVCVSKSIRLWACLYMLAAITLM
jgi:hypothetical protein